MPVRPGEYADLLAPARSLRWKRPRGSPKGTSEVVLHRHRDGSYTHILRIEAGVEFNEPMSHDFYEEVYYIEGEMLNTKSGETIRGGTYVFHDPGEEHGPFRCLKPCLIFETRYYK